MPNLVAVRGVEPWRRRLYLPAYRVVDVAKYVGQSPQLIANWHYRETQRGVTLPGKERGKPLSYMELIEVAVVSAFRRLGVPLHKIREARQYLAQSFHSEYPFAEYRFKTEGFHVLLDLHEFGVDEDMRVVVADKGGQLAWEQVIEDMLLEFTYEYDLALIWHLAGRQSRVTVDPRVAFGAPAVYGLPTWVLKGRYQAGESVDDMKEDFQLVDEAIMDGLAFEGVNVAS